MTNSSKTNNSMFQRNFDGVIWDNKEFNLYPEEIGLLGSLTIVDGMV